MPTHDLSPSQVRLVLTPERAALPSAIPFTLRLLVRVQGAPRPGDASPRDPLHLALVIDRSGSMSGEPLEEAKRCARHVVDQLLPGDRAMIVAFDDEVELLAPLGDDVHALRAALDGIEPGGSTDLHGGWRRGADELAGKLAAQGVHRAILLSDGGANHGETGLEAISAQCRDAARAGVSTSTYGLGRDFNEDLMLAMARAGRGNAYYGRTAADLAEPFAAEFALLSQLCARSLRLRVQVPDGWPVRVRNDYERAAAGGGWTLPDLAYAAEAWALVEIDVPAISSADAHVALPVSVSLEGSARGGAPLYLMQALSALPTTNADAHAAMAPDATVAQRTIELDAADLLEAVRDAVRREAWDDAQRMLDDARARFASHPWAASILAAMAKLVARRDRGFAAKEAAMSAACMRTRLSARDETAAFEVDDASIPAFLRRRAEQGTRRF